MSSNRPSSPLKAGVIGGGVLAAAAVLIAVVANGKRTVAVATVNGEPAAIASANAQGPSATEKKDFSDRRWQQRAEEAKVNQAIANEAHAAGATQARVTGKSSGLEALRGDSDARDGSGRNVPAAGIRDGQVGLQYRDGSVVNARLSGDGTSSSLSRTTKATAQITPTKSPNAELGAGGRGPAPVTGCGDGVIQPGELCEPASSPKCGDDCTPVISEACYDCEVNSPCVALASSCVDYATNKLDQSLCYDVEHCIQDTGCAAGNKTLTSCFCGDLSMEACRSAPISGDKAPHGDCADVIRNAMGLGVSNTYVLTHYASTSTPAGAAIKRFQCLKANETCAPVCFPP